MLKFSEHPLSVELCGNLLQIVDLRILLLSYMQTALKAYLQEDYEAAMLAQFEALAWHDALFEIYSPSEVSFLKEFLVRVVVFGEDPVLTES